MTDHQFKVGNRHENRKGTYEVISINGPMMVIRWDTGEEIETDMKGQAKVLTNMQRELQASTVSHRRGPDWYGEEFTALEDHDFSNDVTGTRWRSREMLGGLVAKNVAGGNLDINSWAIYGSPIVHWADMQRYRRKEPQYQAKFQGMAREDGFYAGLMVERSEIPSEPRDDWNVFMDWLNSGDESLRQVVEQHQLAICDPYRTWSGVFRGVVTAKDGQWLHQATEGGTLVTVPSLYDLLASIGNDTWLDLFIARKYSKEDALKRGRNLAVDVGEILSALVPAYSAATSVA